MTEIIPATPQPWATRFADLPTVPTPPGVLMADDDVEAWGDILYMRGLVDAILDALDAPAAAHDVLGGADSEDGRGLIEFQIDTYLEPWPGVYVDRAAEMLAAWRAESQQVSA